MPYDENLAARVRNVLGPEPDLAERKMFGGLAFLIGGNMACGIVRDELMVRTGSEYYPKALERPHVRPMDFTGRPSKGMVYVAGPALDDAGLREWVERGASYARALPAKKGRI